MTGGEGSLATVLASQLREEGWTVLAPSRRDLDVRNAKSVSAFFENLDRVGALINNAGITRDALLPRQSPEDFSDVIATNLKGAHLCSQAAAVPMLRQRDGHIVNIGSYSAFHPQIGQSAYAAAKAGLVGLTKSYAKELGKRNIRVNCVLPGFLETKMTAEVSEEATDAARKRHALGRFNTAEEAAKFIVNLLSMNHVSGQVFQLDSRA